MLSMLGMGVFAFAGGELVPKSLRRILSGENGYGVLTIFSGIHLRSAEVSIGGGTTCTAVFDVGVGGKLRVRGLRGSSDGGRIE